MCVAGGGLTRYRTRYVLSVTRLAGLPSTTIDSITHKDELEANQEANQLIALMALVPPVEDELDNRRPIN